MLSLHGIPTDCSGNPAGLRFSRPPLSSTVLNRLVFGVWRKDCEPRLIDRRCVAAASSALKDISVGSDERDLQSWLADSHNWVTKDAIEQKTFPGGRQGFSLQREVNAGDVSLRFIFAYSYTFALFFSHWRVH